METTNIQEVLSHFEGVKECGDGKYMACCPCHNDRKQSLSIGRGEKGVVLKCHAGCDTHDIIARVGIKPRDLFYDAERKSSDRPDVVAIYNYPGGVQKLRKSDKSFTWRQPDGRGGYIYNRKGVKPSLYIAGEISGAVAVVEGEKDADSIHNVLGCNAVSGADGAGPGKWRKEYTEQLRGCTALIFQDNDDVGKAYAQETAAALHGVAASVQLLDLATVWPDIPEHGDVSDLIATFGAERAGEMIAQLIQDAPQWEPPKEPDISTLIQACDVAYEPPRWLIAPYIQRGKGTLIQADNGVGKTAFVCGIVAHVTSGEPLLGMPVETPGNVLMLSVEDDLPVLRGRIEADGGDLSKCFFMTNAAELSLNSEEVAAAAAQINAQLVVFDPLQSFLGENVDMYRPNETRPRLSRLFSVCDRIDCACVVISHMTKNSDGRTPVNKALGSVDIPAAMRSIIQITENPDDENERIAVHVKCSNAPKGRSIAYTIGNRGGVHWRGFSTMTVDDLTTIVKRKEKGIPYEREPLVQVFNQLVTDRPGGGFWSYADLKSEGSKILGFPPFGSIADLRQRLDCGLAREMQTHDGLIITHSQRGHGNARGIKIEQYQHPDGYQIKIIPG